MFEVVVPFFWNVTPLHRVIGSRRIETRSGLGVSESHDAEWYPRRTETKAWILGLRLCRLPEVWGSRFLLSFDKQTCLYGITFPKTVIVVGLRSCLGSVVKSGTPGWVRFMTCGQWLSFWRNRPLYFVESLPASNTVLKPSTVPSQLTNRMESVTYSDHYERKVSCLCQNKAKRNGAIRSLSVAWS